jgi:DNA repair exonuclease SbcCD ATPase subunit
LTGIVTRFLRPLGLGLVGVKDQHKRFKWLVTKDGSTYEHHLASGFEKGIIDFMARVAMCLVSSSASRFTQLFIDEGLLAADVTNRSKLGELISQISQDFCGIIMVSHMPEMTEMTEGSINVVRVPVSPTVHHRGNMGKRKFNDMISMKNANND